jgi:tetratricopeptide (TPR) repeat protein/V8-like Glu-specific endopeptidase
MKYSLPLSLAVTLISLANEAGAKTTSEVKSIAQSTVVEVKLQQGKSIGSGIIIHRQGSLYTVVTNRHVLCAGVLCDELPDKNYSLKLSNGEQYQVSRKSIKLLGNDQQPKLDLAIMQFRSDRHYAVAQLAAPASLNKFDTIYATGFPSSSPGFSFNSGKAIAVVNKRLNADYGGYTVIYDAYTLPGMSGGGVFNAEGQLVAIHGKGEIYKPKTIGPLNIKEDTILDKLAVSTINNKKIGYNRGIPALWLSSELNKIGIEVTSARSLPRVTANRSEADISADEHFTTGFNKFVEVGNDVVTGKQQAIQELSQAINLNPNYADAYKLRASIYYQLNEFQLALKDADKVVLLDPNDFSSYIGQGFARENLKDFSSALSSYNQAILVDRFVSGSYYVRGSLKRHKIKDLRGALSDYDLAISLKKNDDYYSSRCSLKAELQDISGAVKDCDTAILLNKESALNYYARSSLRAINLSDYRGAVSDLDQAIVLAPSEAVLYSERCSWKMHKLKDFSGALKDCNDAIDIDPNNVSFYKKRATLNKIYRHDFVSALADHNKIIHLDSSDADNYVDRGWVKIKMNDRQGALADHNKAVSISPNKANIYVERGNVKYEIDDNQGSLKDYNDAIAINPSESFAYASRCRIKYKRLNDFSSALVDCNKAISIDPKDYRAYNHRGKIKVDKLNDISGALADYNQSITLQPSSHTAFYNRGLLKSYHLSDRVGGIQDLRKAAQLFKEYGFTKELKEAIEQLQKLGVSDV